MALYRIVKRYAGRVRDVSIYFESYARAVFEYQYLADKYERFGTDSVEEICLEEMNLGGNNKVLLSRKFTLGKKEMEVTFEEEVRDGKTP